MSIRRLERRSSRSDNELQRSRVAGTVFQPRLKGLLPNALLAKNCPWSFGQAIFPSWDRALTYLKHHEHQRLALSHTQFSPSFCNFPYRLRCHEDTVSKSVLASTLFIGKIAKGW